MADLNLIHRVRLPDPNTGALFPAVVMVHGWQGDENVMWVFERTLPQNAVAVSPRGPVAAEGSYGWFADRSEATDLDTGLEALREFVARLPEAYPVDSARITLMGFSQGAAMCYALILSQPTSVKGVAALAGFLPQPAQAWIRPGRLAGKPVFIAHGLEDETVPVEASRQARESLTQAGAVVIYREYPIGHKLPAQGMRDLKEWLAANC